MIESARESIYEAIASIRLIDPHTHINPHNPASQTLADILGYHYYTELVHSAGMPKSQIEEDGISPRELVGRLVRGLPNIENTANYQWLINICRTFFDFDDDRITLSNWESLYDVAEQKMSSAEWPQMVLDKSNVEAVFLTNDFDDALEGFDSNTYIPCLRTDDLVFHLDKPEVRERLAACSGIELDGSLENLRAALRQRFEHFVPRGARACAISIPPSFEPGRVPDGRAQTALDAVLRQGGQANVSHHTALSRRVFWTLAELCDEFGLPFDLMIGVNRRVYPEGVFQGQDLYDSRVSLIQYRELFNAFPAVKFPVSVLASVTNQELVSYAWIFPNVVTNGHWWYSNTPSFIAKDTAARLEAVPRNKQIGYYSDAYKLEFVWPKFDMYRRILSGVLADHFVGGCGWSEERAIELGRQILRDNVDSIFPNPLESSSDRNDTSYDDSASGLVQETSMLGSLVPDVDEVEVIDSPVQYEEAETLVTSQEPAAFEDPVAELLEETDSETDEGIGEAGMALGAGAALAAGALGMAGLADAGEELEAPLEEASQEQPLYQDQPLYQERGPLYEQSDAGPESETEEVVDEIEVESDEAEFEQSNEASEDKYELEDEYEDVDEEDAASLAENADYLEHETEYEAVEETAVEQDAADDAEYEDVEEAADPLAESALEDDEEKDDDADSGTVIGIEETVRIEDELESIADEAYDLDPTPSDDEIQSVEVDDVELSEVGAMVGAVGDIEAEIDPEPLDVGNLLSEEVEKIAQEVGEQAEPTEVRQLRGEAGFVPDEDSLKLNPDPVTGELTFGAGLFDETEQSADDAVNEVESMIQETIDFENLSDVVNPEEEDFEINE